MRATVCPHDTARGLPLWIEFFVVLGAVSGRAIGFQPAADFPEFYRLWNQVDLIYANPLDALRLADERGFLPLVSNDRYDEAVFLVRDGLPASLEVFDGAEVGMVEGQFATLLAKRLLAERGIHPRGYRPFASWGEVLDALRRGELACGVLYRDFYEALSPVSREGTTLVFSSEERRFSHLFLLSPELQDELEAMRESFLKLTGHPMAEPVLKDLGIGRFFPVKDLSPIRALVES